VAVRQKQRENLVGEDFLDNLVLETTDTLKSTIRGCASLGHQHMDMGMEKGNLLKRMFNLSPFVCFIFDFI